MGRAERHESCQISDMVHSSEMFDSIVEDRRDARRKDLHAQGVRGTQTIPVAQASVEPHDGCDGHPCNGRVVSARIQEGRPTRTAGANPVHRGCLRPPRLSKTSPSLSPDSSIINTMPLVPLFALLSLIGLWQLGVPLLVACICTVCSLLPVIPCSLVPAALHANMHLWHPTNSARKRPLSRGSSHPAYTNSPPRVPTSAIVQTRSHLWFGDDFILRCLLNRTILRPPPEPPPTWSEPSTSTNHSTYYPL